MSEAWRPFGLDEAEREAYAVLRPGVPAPMLELLLGWVHGVLQHSLGAKYWQRNTLLEVQGACDVPLGIASWDYSYVEAQGVRSNLRGLAPMALLRVVDCLVSRSYARSDRAIHLEHILAEGRSMYRVGERHGKPGLVERVPAGVQATVEGVITSSGSAGDVLAKAWSDVHGLEPKDSSAYSYAVRAVEIASAAVVTPNKRDATLGNVIGQMKSDGDWRLPFREHPEAPSAEVLLAMVRTLWVGHRDRHGSADYSDVAHDEARAAVTLAATLVDWFVSDAVQRRRA